MDRDGQEGPEWAPDLTRICPRRLGQPGRIIRWVATPMLPPEEILLEALLGRVREDFGFSHPPAIAEQLASVPVDERGSLAEAARQALDAATSPDELLLRQAQIDAVFHLIRNLVPDQQAKLDEQNWWAALKFEALRRIGQWLIDRKDGTSHDGRTLTELGIGYNQSWRWQRLAQLSETRFRREVEQATKQERELTQAGLIKIWEKNYGQQHRRAAPPRQPPSIECPHCHKRFIPSYPPATRKTRSVKAATARLM